MEGDSDVRSNPRSPPPLSPAVSVPSTASPPPPLLAANGSSPPPVRPGFMPGFYFPPYPHHSPPPIHTSDPTANDCKLIECKGQKVAAFIINGDSMLCLPQVFEIFLKHLVGGLHTVYTKLKRLGIEPLVCNVEQVRVLRGLGAIQPGVNRCKLLSAKHFDILYKDCTTARPGRPPKRPHEIMGITTAMQGSNFVNHGGLPPNHLSPEALMALKKTRMDGREFSFVNGGLPTGNPENDLEKSPLLSNGYNPPPKTLMAQYMALNGGIPHPAFLAHSGLPIPPHPAPWVHHPPGHPFKSGPHAEDIARTMAWENYRSSYDEVIKHLERMREERNRSDRILAIDREENHERNSSPPKSNGFGESDILNLSGKAESREDDLSDNGEASTSSPRLVNQEDDKDEIISDNDDLNYDKNELSDREDLDYRDKSHAMSGTNYLMISTVRGNSNSSANSASSCPPISTASVLNSGVDKSEDRFPHGLNFGTSLMGVGMALGANEGASGPPIPSMAPLSSLENLLGNIQNLLKVATESVRHEEQLWFKEKEQLRMEFLRQKELKEKLEKQLIEDEKIKMLYLRKLKKEKKARRRLEEELTEKLKRLAQYEPNAQDLLRAAESLAKEGVKNASVFAAAVAAAAATGHSGPPISESAVRLSPPSNQQDIMEARTPTSQNECPSVFFNKSLLFNCST